jgi:hypothetical protein
MRRAFATLTLAALSWAAAPWALADTRGIELSPSLQLGWDATLRPSLTQDQDSLELRGRFLSQPFSVEAMRKPARAMASDSRMATFWKRNLLHWSLKGERSKDLGCRLVAPAAFRCDRLAHYQAKRFVAESALWNGDSDLVLLRVTSRSSANHAKSVLDQLKLEIGNRAPARAVE